VTIFVLFFRQATQLRCSVSEVRRWQAIMILLTSNLAFKPSYSIEIVAYLKHLLTLRKVVKKTSCHAAMVSQRTRDY